MKNNRRLILFAFAMIMHSPLAMADEVEQGLGFLAKGLDAKTFDSEIVDTNALGAEGRNTLLTFDQVMKSNRIATGN